MAEETAGTATAAQTSASPVQQAAPPAQASEPLKAPLIPDPEAFLARANARRFANAGPSTKSGTVSNENSARQPVSTTTQDESGNEPQNKDLRKGTNSNSAESSKATIAGPGAGSITGPEAGSEDLADRIAKFSREARELAQQQAEFKAEQARIKAEREEAAKQHEAKLRQAETVEKAAKAIESGDIAGALKALKGDINPSAIALQLLEQLQKEDERPMSQAEVDRMIAERLKVEGEARAKAEEEAKKKAAEEAKAAEMATLEGARERYMEACSSAFSKEKHPFIAAHGLKREEVTAYVESQRDERGRMLPTSPEDALEHFETLYRKRAEAAGWAPRTVDPPKPAPAPSFSQAAMAQDSGGRLVENQPRKTLEQLRAEAKRQLRIGGVQT